MSSALVTGGAGFIGSHLVAALHRAGWAVRVLDDLSSGDFARLADLPAVELIQADVCDGAAVAAAAAGVSAIFHLAARVSVVQSVAEPIPTYDVNLGGTLNVLEAARANRVKRVVLASTCAVYGDGARLPAREDDPVAPQSPYAAAKLAAEQACALYHRLYGVEAVALRFFNVYGPGQDPNSPYAAVVPRFLAALRAGGQPTIFGDGRQTRDFVFVGDVVAGLIAAAALPELGGRVLNLGRGAETSVLELAEILSGLLGQQLRPKFRPARPGELLRSRADVSAFAAAGFRAEVALADGLARTVSTV